MIKENLRTNDIAGEIFSLVVLSVTAGLAVAGIISSAHMDYLYGTLLYTVVLITCVFFALPALRRVRAYSAIGVLVATEMENRKKTVAADD